MVTNELTLFNIENNFSNEFRIIKLEWFTLLEMIASTQFAQICLTTSNPWFWLCKMNPASPPTKEERLLGLDGPPTTERKWQMYYGIGVSLRMPWSFGVEPRATTRIPKPSSRSDRNNQAREWGRRMVGTNKVIPIFKVLHSNANTLFIFNNSMNHRALAPDALSVNRINLSDGRVNFKPMPPVGLSTKMEREPYNLW